MENSDEKPGPSYFLARIGAHLLDLLVCFCIFYVVGMAVAARYGGLGGRGQFNVEGLPALVIIAAAGAAGFLYFVVLEGLAGRTFGKMICGLKVVHEDGGPAGIVSALVRNFLRIADAFLFYVVGLVFMLTSKGQQRLGDKLAKTRVVPSPSRVFQVAGILLVIATIGGAVFGAIRIQAVAELNAKMEVLNARYTDSEGGPAVGKTYAVGDEIFLLFDLVNVPVDVKGGQGGMDVAVQFQVQDPAGHSVVEPVNLPVSGPGPKTFGEPTPLRFHLTLPIYAVGGEHTIQISAKDHLKNKEASFKIPFTVDGPQIAANMGFSVQDHGFLAQENGPPLPSASYQPGAKVLTRFHAVGFKVGPEQSVKIRLDLGMISETGQKLLDQPNVVNIDQKFFYVPAYLPITATINTPPDVAPGRYRIQYILHDDVAGTQISLEEPFSIAPQSF